MTEVSSIAKIALRRRLWHFVRALLASVGALVMVVMFTPLVEWWGHALSGGFNDPQGDVLIVLGAAESTDGLLSYSSYFRATYAIQAYREGWVRSVVITGDAAPDENGGNPIRDFMISHAMPREIIRLESAARSTRENALYTKPILSTLPGTKVLLTSDYHMYRAGRVFRRAGIQFLPRPFPDAVKRGTRILTRWSAFVDLCTETVKIGYYWARGWI